MSPAALDLLTKAYENYLDTYDRYFSYIFKNADDLYFSIVGAQQLCEDGYIKNASDNIFSDRISIVPLDPISFSITDKGIDYMRSNRKS